MEPKSPVRRKKVSTKRLVTELKTLRDKLEKYHEAFIEDRAELENYKKRLDRNLEEEKWRNKADVVKAFLQILDDLYIWSSYGVKDATVMVSKLETLLEMQGVVPIPEEKYFNPHIHNAILTTTSTEEGNLVTQVFRKGYMLDGKLIRPADVAVTMFYEANT